MARGKISDAIKAYQQIVENDPDDVNTVNMLGDLHLKADDQKSAIRAYELVAEHYHLNGFEKKAVAVYNKIHRLEPDSKEIAIKLAELYEQRGSRAEARAHYAKLAEDYESEGKQVEAFTIWEKIAELDPKNNEIYLKIADFYWQNDQEEEAARAFVEGGNRLAQSEKHEEAVAAFSRALEVTSSDLEAIRGYVNSQIKLGYPEEGVKTLEEILEKEPYNKDVICLSVDCYLDMEDPEQAEKILVDLITQEPKSYPKLLDLAEFYLQRDDLDSAVRILSMISEQLLVSQEPERLLDSLNEVIARDPEHIPALRLLTRYHGWHKDDFELERVLIQMMDAAKISGSIEDEQFALRQLLLISPQDDKYVSRLKEVSEFGKTKEVEPEEVEPASEENVRSFEQIENELYSADSFGEEQEAEIQLTEADLQPEIIEDDEKEASETKTISTEEQIENLKFYIDQGYLDVAEHTLKEIDENCENRAYDEVREIITKMNEESAEEGETPEQNSDGSENMSAVSTSEDSKEEKAVGELETEDAVSETQIEEDSVSEEVDEERASDESEASVEAEPEAEVEAAEETEADEVALEEDIEDEKSEAEEQPESSELSPRSSDEEGSPSESVDDQEEADSSTGAEKEDMSAVLGTEEDYENHYHHAVAYQEMGLLEDAIREFQGAIGCINPKQHSKNYLQCCTLLAHCFIEKSSFEDSIEWFNKAMLADGLEEEEKQALNYEIGNAHLMKEDFENALGIFEELHNADPGYRDVAKRLEQCKAQAELVAA